MSLCRIALLLALCLMAWSRGHSTDTNITDSSPSIESHSFDIWTKQQVGQRVERLSQEAVELTSSVEKLTTQLSSLYGAPNKAKSMYIRWGARECPGGTELMYSGVVGGGWYDHYGSATNPLCLPRDPIYDDRSASGKYAFLYGAEYHVNPDPKNNLDPTCAVCVTKQELTFMLPARNACYPGWKMQYSGYLMAGRYSHKAASEYVCMDGSMETDHSSDGDKNGKLFYYVFNKCGSLPCPPYQNDKMVTCVVCSK